MNAKIEEGDKVNRSASRVRVNDPRGQRITAILSIEELF